MEEEIKQEKSIKKSIKKDDKLSLISTVSACVLGMSAFFIGLYNSEMALSEQGYYAVLLLYSVFSSISLQKTMLEIDSGISVSKFYRNICMISIVLALLFFIMGLFNAELLKSEKGFYAMSYILTLFSSLGIQKMNK